MTWIFQTDRPARNKLRVHARKTTPIQSTYSKKADSPLGVYDIKSILDTTTHRMTRSAVSHKIRKLVATGVPRRRAVAMALSMRDRGRLGPRGGYRRTKTRRSPVPDRIVSCRRVPANCNRKSCRSRHRKCRKSNGRVYSIPRLYSPAQCRTMRRTGFTQRASCTPYL